METNSKVCPTCGRSYSAERRFCEKDGSELEAARPARTPIATTPDTGADTHPAAPKRGLSRETLAGGMIVLVIVLTVGIVFAVREAGIYRLKIVFEEAHGLKIGDSVFVRGADVGEVVSARFEGGVFVADITVRQDGAEQLRQGSLFFVGYDKIFVNRRCLAVYVPDARQPPLRSGDQLRGIDSWFTYYGTILKDKGPAEAMRAYGEMKGFMNQAADAAGAKPGQP